MEVHKMKININNKNLAIAAAGALATTATGIAAYFAKRTYKIEKKFDILVGLADDVYKKTDIEVGDAFVKAVAKTKIEYMAAEKVNSATRDIINDYKDTLRSRVEEEVKDKIYKHKKAIDKKIQEEIDKIDVDDFRKEAIHKAEKELTRKLERDSEKILEKYFDRLDRETELYSDFLDKMSNKKESIKKIMED